MGNFTVNIDAHDVMSQVSNEPVMKYNNSFDVKNYLQARLADNEQSKEITIRLLPFSMETDKRLNPDGSAPFHKVYMHNIKVNARVSPSGYKRIPCPKKNIIPGYNDTSELQKDCPFCNAADYARNLRKTATTQSEKDTCKSAISTNLPHDVWVIRCIERGHEEDGVKFWMFNDSMKKDGVYDKIFAIFKKRLEKGRNIFDLNSGKDICLSLNRDSTGKTAITITDDDDWTPLTNDYEQGMKWLNDPKKWTDVYTFKPYEYMKILGDGGVPKYDTNLGKYIDAEKADKDNQPINKPTQDLSSIPYGTPKVEVATMPPINRNIPQAEPPKSLIYFFNK